MAEVVAAIDCGSNSTRLLIASREQVHARAMRITRLSEGVDAARTLATPALARTYAVLDEYRAIMDRFEVSRGLLVATSAVRDASNGPTFVAEAERRTRITSRILTGREEATFSYEGAVAELAPATVPTLIVDVGGGSTELCVRADDELASYSMQLGCVRISERALGSGVVTAELARAAREMIDAELDRAFAAVPVFGRVVGNVRMVGLAGTVATLAQLDAALATYDRDVVHHRLLTREVVVRWRDRLGAETAEQRLAHLGMVRGREDVLVGGLYVLDAVMERFGVQELLSSESDILDGIVRSLL
ncbi:MAG TPA: hypothetical protein VMV53_01025 [Acidimicrobiales bacterium]|nr:hypothetical protein [Acidimicrobiales bacterium]